MVEGTTAQDKSDDCSRWPGYVVAAFGLASAMDNEEVQRWLPRRRVKEEAALRLWAFHWFGASASAFGPWEWHMTDDVELCAVQLPGRENRLQEAPLSSAKEAAMQIVDAMMRLFEEKPYALFGHSSGCWIAYEVAIELRKRGAPPPVLMIVSDFPAPQTPGDLRPWKVVRDLSDSEFRQQLMGWGLPALLFEQKQTWALFEPKLRREMAQFDEYEFDADEAPLPCPIAAYLSQECPKVGPKEGNPELMEGWANVSTHAQMTVDVFFGDHFYLQDSAIYKEVARTVGDRTGKLADLLTFDL